MAEFDYEEARGKLAMVALMSLVSKKKYEAKALAATNQGSADEMVIAMMASEATRGFMCGVSACLAIFEGKDGIAAYRDFIDALDAAGKEALESDFKRQVERYSESGEG